MPVFHPALIPPAINARIQQDGLCGFTGSMDTVDNLPSLESCLPALADWGITADKLIRSPRGSEEEETMVRNAGKEVHEFVKRRWKESQWETAWFVNPPVSFICDTSLERLRRPIILILRSRGYRVYPVWRISTCLHAGKQRMNRLPGVLDYSTGSMHA